MPCSRHQNLSLYIRADKPQVPCVLQRPAGDDTCPRGSVPPEGCTAALQRAQGQLHPAHSTAEKPRGRKNRVTPRPRYEGPGCPSYTQAGTTFYLQTRVLPTHMQRSRPHGPLETAAPMAHEAEIPETVLASKPLETGRLCVCTRVHAHSNLNPLAQNTPHVRGAPRPVPTLPRTKHTPTSPGTPAPKGPLTWVSCPWALRTASLPTSHVPTGPAGGHLHHTGIARPRSMLRAPC